MGKSINPMFSFMIRGEAPFGSAPSLIVLMSLQPAIPRQVALLQCLPPLHRLDSMFHLPAGTVNHHLIRAGEFSTGRTRNFQPELTLTFKAEAGDAQAQWEFGSLLDGGLLDPRGETFSIRPDK